MLILTNYMQFVSILYDKCMKFEFEDSIELHVGTDLNLLVWNKQFIAQNLEVWEAIHMDVKEISIFILKMKVKI